MKSKLAIWSWILPAIGYGLYLLLISILNSFIPDRSGDLDILFIIIFILGSTISGLIFGIIGLKVISRNPVVTGRASSIIGIILNTVLFFYGILILGGGLIGG